MELRLLPRPLSASHCLWNTYSAPWGVIPYIAAVISALTLEPPGYPLLLGGEKQLQIKCLAQGHKQVALLGFELPTSRLEAQILTVAPHASTF